MELRDKEINNDNSDINNEATAAENEPAVVLDEKIEVLKKDPFWKRFVHSEFFNLKMKILFGLFFLSLSVYVLSRFLPAFAEFWTRYPAQGLRFILAKLTGWIPFSFAECVIISLPILAVAYIVGSTVSTKRDGSNENFHRWLRPIVSILLIIIILFLAAFGPAYGRKSLAENLNLVQQDISAEELYDTAVIIAQIAEKELDSVKFDHDGLSIMPYDFLTLADKVNEAFEKYAAGVDYISHFNSSPKPIALSKPMSYTHISGVYTFMTGEANINTNYPDFLTPFTMAHEMAHQRGIAREDEANFVAFLVCINSDDAYLRYSGYANMLNYLCTAIADASPELYVKFSINHLPTDILGEFVAYSVFFDQYRDSIASDVTGAVNDTFLQSQGQEAGTKSYGLVVDLAVAYYKQ